MNKPEIKNQIENKVGGSLYYTFHCDGLPDLDFSILNDDIEFRVTQQMFLKVRRAISNVTSLIHEQMNEK